MSTRRVQLPFRLGLATALAAIVLVIAPVPVNAASFNSIPDRLYMVPAGGNTSLPPGIPGPIVTALSGLKVGTLPFDGTQDLIVFDGTDDGIVNDRREIVLTATEGPKGCDLIDAPEIGTVDYDIDDCTRIILSATGGRIKVQDSELRLRDFTSDPPGAPVAGDPNPADWLWRFPDGAVLDAFGGGDAGTDHDGSDPTDAGNPNDPDGYLNLEINGDTDMLNAVLETLVFVPPAGYRYSGESPAPSIRVTLSGGDGVSPSPWTIPVRVLEVNEFPTHTGPTTYDAPAATEVAIPGTFTVEDPDNDEDVDGAQATPPVAEEDYPDGPDANMLFVAYLDCGTTPAANTGVHFASATFAPVVGTIAGYLETILDPTGVGPFVEPALQALEGIAPGLADATIQTSEETDWATLFAGVGTMKEVRDALSTVTFRHDTPSDTCTLFTIVSDLGNNGLPVQFLSDPAPQDTEIPMIGFAWNELVISTGELQEITIDFDPEAIVALEADSPNVGAALHISPATHPEFTVRWDVLPIVGDPDVPGQATANDDFGGTSNNTLVIPANATLIPFPLDNLDSLPDAPNTNVWPDDDPEGNETFRFQLVLDANDPPDGWVIKSDIPSRSVVIIDEDDGPREVTSVSNASVLEGDGGTTTMTFTVMLDGLADGNESFVVNTVDGTATAPADYLAIMGDTYTFAPGTDSLDIDVIIEGDTFVEPDPHSFTLEISDPTNLTLGADTTGTGSIDDDDVPSVSIDDVAIAEGDSATTNAVFTVTLSEPANSDVTVQYATSNGTASTADPDYSSTTGTATVPMGDTETTINVPIIGDHNVEADETFVVNLTSPTGATLADASGTGTIQNDDTASLLSIGDTTIAEGNTSPLTVSMTQPTGRVCAVNVTTTDGSGPGSAAAPGDYTALTNSPVTLNGVASASTNLVTVADVDPEGPETLIATIALAGAPTPDCALGDATATITIDDTLSLPVLAAVGDASIIEGDSGSTNLVFTITLSGGLVTGSETIAYSTSDGTAMAGSDYTSTSGTATFGPGMGTAQVMVPVGGDFAVEADETLTLMLSNPIGVTITDGSATGTIQNDDAPSVLTIADKTIIEGNLDQLTVSMTEPTGRVCAVTVTTTNGTATAPGDFDALSGALVTLNAVPSATTDLSTISDGVAEGPETLTAAIALAGAPTPDCVLGDATAIVTIDDTPTPLAAQVSDVSIAEGNAGTTNLVFTIAVSTPAETGDETVDFATSDGTATAGVDYTTTTGTATFAAGASTFEVNVPIIGDVVDEFDETLILTIDNPIGLSLVDDGEAIGTILDDDAPDDPEPDPLTIATPANIVRPNDPGQAGAVVAWAAPTTTGGTAPIVVTCVPAAGSFFPLGATTVTCTATDSAAAQTASGTFTVTVVDNEPPTIADLPDLVQTTPNGPVPVTFPLPAASDNSGVGPTVTCADPSGTFFAVGVTTVTCTATDGAGNSASSTFTVTVVLDATAPLPPQPGPASTPAPAPAPTPTTTTTGPTIPAGGELPATGGTPGRLLLTAAGLVLLGVLLRQGRRSARA